MRNYKIFHDKDKVISGHLGEFLETGHKFDPAGFEEISDFFLFLSSEFLDEFSAFPVTVLKLDEFLLQLHFMTKRVLYRLFRGTRP